MPCGNNNKPRLSVHHIDHLTFNRQQNENPLFYETMANKSDGGSMVGLGILS